MSMLAPFGNYGRYLQRAIALVATTGMNKLTGEPFYDPMYTGFNAVAGTVVGPWLVNRTAIIGTTTGLALQGGVQRIGVTGGGAAGFSAFDLNGYGACLFHTLGTERWYTAYRARSLTGVTATEGAYVGLVDAAGTNCLRVGLNGRASATNFSIASGLFNTVVTSQVGPTIDTAFHDFEMWSVAATGGVGWAVDGITQTELAGPAFTDMHLFGIVEIAAADVTCTLDIDNVFQVAVSP